MVQIGQQLVLDETFTDRQIALGLIFQEKLHIL